MVKVRRHFHRLKQSEYARILVLRTVGNFLIFSALFLLAKTFYPPVQQELIYAYHQWAGKKYVVATPDQVPQKGSLSRLLALGKVEILNPADPQFDVVIPKIGANARVLPDVDPANEPEYLDALKKGVAHAAGTAFPGEGGHIFLFAHSTDYIWNVSTYNAVFYLLYKVEKGDEVDIFYKGQRYVYKVIDKRVVDPSEVEYITRKTDQEFLTLQTCWPPGTTLKRLLVFATRVAN
jgi:LPXTG-site transpeptidase (sortase) family protein